MEPRWGLSPSVPTHCPVPEKKPRSQGPRLSGQLTTAPPGVFRMPLASGLDNLSSAQEQVAGYGPGAT